MYIVRRTLILFLIPGILLSSCGPQEPGQPTPDMNAILTAGVGTFAASIFQTQTAMVPPATATPTVTPTATVTPLSLLSPTGSTASATQFILVAPQATLVVATPTGPTLTPNPSTLGSGCNNLALISDIPISPSSIVKPEDQFTKSWKVANTGTCDWVYRYQLVFVSGDDVGGRDPVSLGKVIPPGKWTQLTITLRAPKAPGKYTSYWRFADQSGTVFGSTLGVSIEVKASYP
ncbi:MAG: NBR1-Ig-like domain-containing protein [Anaerolineales bacterium]